MQKGIEREKEEPYKRKGFFASRMVRRPMSEVPPML
jgi:hypothetical protein